MLGVDAKTIVAPRAPRYTRPGASRKYPICRACLAHDSRSIRNPEIRMSSRQATFPQCIQRGRCLPSCMGHALPADQAAYYMDGVREFANCLIQYTGLASRIPVSVVRHSADRLRPSNVMLCDLCIRDCVAIAPERNGSWS